MPPTTTPTPNAHASDPASASREPPIVTTVPPSAGPDHGATPLTTSDTSSKRTPLDVYSRPFVLTSTDAYPADDQTVVVALHNTADSLTYAARTTVALNRQRNAPHASADAEKPPPSTVTALPPSDAPRTGHTEDTDAAGRYVNATPLAENC